MVLAHKDHISGDDIGSITLISSSYKLFCHVLFTGCLNCNTLLIDLVMYHSFSGLPVLSLFKIIILRLK